MKTIITRVNQKFLLIFLSLFIFPFCDHVLAQTGTCTVLQQPCNNDGILAVSITSGLLPPLTFTYSNYWNHTVHSNINILKDTLFNASGCDWVYVTDNFSHSIYLQSGMHPPFNVDYPHITNPVCPDTMGSILITIDQGVMPDSVQWFISAYPNFGPYMGAGNPMNLPNGLYSIIVYANGCSTAFPDSNVINVSSISNLNYTVSVTTASCNNGTASVSNVTGGNPPFTYQWSNGANTPSINNLFQGYYVVTVTDAQGCSTSKYATVSQLPFISVNVSHTNATCLQNDGSLIAFGSGGTPPYNYAWSNGMTGQTIGGLSGGSLHVIATDANGCIGNGNGYVGVSTPVMVTYTSIPSSCMTPTGSATLTISGGTGPYTVTWNTYPQQSGTTLSNMFAGNYSFMITDAVGCVRSGTANINPQSMINGYTTVVNPICPSISGSVSVYAGGTNPPFTFHWNDGSTAQSITNASVGNYCCTITDNIGCQLEKCASVNSLSPMTIGFSATPASCIYMNNGSLYAMAGGGTAPYTYDWSNGQTGNMATGLLTGNYSVTVQDAHGCTKSNSSTIGYNLNNDSCYCTIRGKVYADLNNNCLYDIPEQGISHILVHCNGFGYTWTDANGDYSFIVPTGSYTLSEQVLYLYPLAPCQSNSIPVNVTAGSGCLFTVDFANVIFPLHDVHIITNSLSPAIPGFYYNQGVIIQNDGTVSESDIQLGYQHDGQLQYINSFPVPFTQLSPVSYPGWYSITSGFPALAPGASTMLHTNYYVPPNIPINTMVQFYDTTAYASPVTNWLADYSPWNNINDYRAYIVASYDPNNKEVSPRGIGEQGIITPHDSVMDYVIHFQNIGNYLAQNIVVVDTLDSDLDWTSLRPGYSSHNYTASMSEDGVLRFTFSNINLPPKNQNEFGSMGLIAYTIKQKPQLSNGTEIKNAADIYFDFNAPVTTNTTLNTIDKTVNLNDADNQGVLSIFPNPASDLVNITFKLNESADIYFSIHDIMGRKMMEVAENYTSGLVNKQMDVSEYSNGIYIIIVNVSGKQYYNKLIKQDQ